MVAVVLAGLAWLIFGVLGVGRERIVEAEVAEKH